MKRVSFFASIMAMMLPVLASTTQVVGTVRDVNQNPVNGLLILQWPAFTTGDGNTIVSGRSQYNISNGIVYLNLAATANSVPAGVTYSATFLLSGSTSVQVESWSVPVSGGPVSLASIRQSQTGPFAMSSNTVRTCSGAPANSTGFDGDYCIDPTAKLWYGPKVNGAWPSSQQFGGTGPTGATGATGNAGLTLTNFVVTRTSSTVLNLAAIGNVTATGSGTGEVMIWYPNGGPITVGLPAGVTATCDSGCAVAPGVTSTPVGAILLYQWSMTAGAWDSGGGIDAHAFFQYASVSNGTGTVVSVSGNQFVVSVDSSIVQIPAGTAPTTVGSACSTPNYYLDGTYRWDCVANTWQRISWGASAGASPGGSSGDVQTNNGAGGFSGIHTTGSGVAVLATNPSFPAGVSVNGTVNMGTSGTVVTSSGTHLQMAVTGDTYGAVSMDLQNRNGLNGALFSNVLPLVDFGFNAAGVQKNVRFETRSGELTNAGNTFEFQIGTPNTIAAPPLNGLSVGDVTTTVKSELNIPSQKAATGNRSLCIDTAGHVFSSATGCGPGT